MGGTLVNESSDVGIHGLGVCCNATDIEAPCSYLVLGENIQCLGVLPSFKYELA